VRFVKPPRERVTRHTYHDPSSDIKRLLEKSAMPAVEYIEGSTHRYEVILGSRGLSLRDWISPIRHRGATVDSERPHLVLWFGFLH